MARGYGDPRSNEFGSDDNRERWRDDDRERSNWRSGSQGTSEREDERGFFERAGEEIRSWFSDDDDDRGGRRDHERGQSGGGWQGRTSWDRDNDRSSRSQGGGWSGGSSWERENRGGISDRDRERSYGRIGRGGSDYMNQDPRSSSFSGTGRSSWDRNQGRGPSRGGGYWSESSNRDRSSMGGYGENRGGFGGFRDESDFRGQHRRDHPQSWGEANRGGHHGHDRSHDRGSMGYGDMSETLGGFGNQTFGSSQDDHYRSWRDRQMQQLDKDYGDYCREREQQFHSDFDSWRRSRPSSTQGQTGSASNADFGSASNAGVGTTTSSVTGSAGSGSANAAATGTGGSIQSDTTGDIGTTEPAGSGRSTEPAGSGRSRRS